MGIDLDQRDRSMTLEGAQNRDRDAVVAADGDGHGASGKDLAYRFFGADRMAAEIGHVGRHVADIDHFQGTSAVDRATDVEIVAFQAATDAIGDRADSIGCLRLVVGDRAGMVGAAVGNAEDGNVRVESVEIGANRRPEQALVLQRRRHRQGQNHTSSKSRSRSQQSGLAEQIGIRRERSAHRPGVQQP